MYLNKHDNTYAVQSEKSSAFKRRATCTILCKPSGHNAVEINRAAQINVQVSRIVTVHVYHLFTDMTFKMEETLQHQGY